MPVLDYLHSERMQRDAAYKERNEMVVFVAGLYPSHLKRHSENDLKWERDWMNIACIHGPAGQMTWHIHDSEAGNFGFLNVKPDPFKDCVWDGHTTEEKYNRLRQCIIGQRSGNGRT